MKIQNIIRLKGVIAASMIAGALLLSSRQVHAQANGNPPNLMTYQGYLVDGNGVALGTNAPKNYDVIFRIWSAPTGGTNLWTEQQTVTVDKGYFSVLLGEGSSTGDPRPPLNTVFTNNTASDRWIGLTVKGIGPGDVDILPRLRLLTSPYSFLASRALTVDPSTAVADGNLSTNVALRNATQTFTGVNTFSNAVRISGNNALEFGAAISGKQSDAGKIGYQTFTTGALDIVGAGTNTNRKIKFWNEGGAEFSGPITATSYNGSGANLSGVATLNGNNTFNGSSMTFGNQMFPLAITQFGRMEMWAPFGPFFGPGLILHDLSAQQGGNGKEGGIGYTLNGGEWSTDAQRGDITLRSSGGKVLIQSGSGASAICISTANRVGIGNLNPSTYLQVVSATCNGSSWVNASDRNLKQDFSPVNPLDVLAKVVSMPVQSWAYKAQPDEKHIGPVAQDFHEAFGLNGSDNTRIATVDESGVALAAIQGLNQKLEQKEAEITELKSRLERLEQLLSRETKTGAAK